MKMELHTHLSGIENSAVLGQRLVQLKGNRKLKSGKDPFLDYAHCSLGLLTEAFYSGKLKELPFHPYLLNEH